MCSGLSGDGHDQGGATASDYECVAVVAGAGDVATGAADVATGGVPGATGAGAAAGGGGVAGVAGLSTVTVADVTVTLGLICAFCFLPVVPRACRVALALRAAA